MILFTRSPSLCFLFYFLIIFFLCLAMNTKKTKVSAFGSALLQTNQKKKRKQRRPSVIVYERDLEGNRIYKDHKRYKRNQCSSTSNSQNEPCGKSIFVSLKVWYSTMKCSLKNRFGPCNRHFLEVCYIIDLFTNNYFLVLD